MLRVTSYYSIRPAVVPQRLTPCHLPYLVQNAQEGLYMDHEGHQMPFVGLGLTTWKTWFKSFMPSVRCRTVDGTTLAVCQARPMSGLVGHLVPPGLFKLKIWSRVVWERGDWSPNSDTWYLLPRTTVNYNVNVLKIVK